MDPWINSLVQSPLVRSLNTVPSRMSSFAYGVRDNVPPFSFVKEVVDQNSGSAGWSHLGNTGDIASPAAPFEFRIPESGLLDRMYLRVRMYSPNGTRPALDPMPITSGGVEIKKVYNKLNRDARSSSMNFASIFETAILRTTGNKEIQTLFPAAIAAEVQKMPSAQRQFWYQCLNGFAAGIKTGNPAVGTTSDALVAPFTQLYNPYAEAVVAVDNPVVKIATENGQNQFADFLIPLPFAVLDQLKDNFQTRFVDDMTVAVKLRVDPALSAVTLPVTQTAGFRVSLVCLFHNFHDVIENSIRDQNFKRGFPASVYSHNCVREATTSVAGKKLTVRLGSKNLISEMHFALKHQDEGSTTQLTALPVNDGSIGPFRFTLYGSGRQLWQAFSWELSSPDVADYQLADAHAYGEDLAKPVMSEIVKGRSLKHTAVAPTNATADNVTLGFPHLYSMRFGFQAHDSFYTGGLALQTISNPYVEIENLGESSTLWDKVANNYTMDVILKSCIMLRIDSDTGVITTSLDV